MLSQHHHSTTLSLSFHLGLPGVRLALPDGLAWLASEDPAESPQHCHLFFVYLDSVCTYTNFLDSYFLVFIECLFLVKCDMCCLCFTLLDV